MTQQWENLWKLVVNAVLFGVSPILLCAIAATIFYSLIWRFTDEYHESSSRFLPLAIFVVAFATLGGAVGLFLGASREPVVAVILPAVLTFISAFLAYLFTKEEGSTTGLRTAIPTATMLLLLAAIFTASFGAGMRDRQEMIERKYADTSRKNELLYWPLQLEIGKKNLAVEKAKELLAIEAGQGTSD